MDEFERRLEREKLAALKELAYGASHEINNPLANIATRAQILLKDEAHPERHAQAMRAHEMIADLMLFASPPALVLAEVDLNGLVEQVVASWRDRAQEQSTELAFSASADPTVAAADATQVAVAVDAVVRNALEAVAAGGRVRVTVRRSELEGSGSVEILVADSGPGMSVETRRHAFDPFFSGREAGRGLGFGLSKCWRIIDEHGGEVLLASAPGAGTEVTLRLPIRRRDS
jgi:signal transduction histidine kinase